MHVDDGVSDGQLAAAKFPHEPDVERDVYGIVVAHTVTGLHRLHFVGNRGKRPGEYLLHFDCFGMDKPQSTEYDKQRRNGFSDAIV